MEIDQKNRELIEKIVEVNGEDLLYAGAWFLVAGTSITAAGETKVFLFQSEEGLPAVAIGNAVEAVGNAIQAIGREKLAAAKPYFPGRKIATAGCWLQAGGNVANTVATNIEIEANEQEDEEAEDASYQLNALGSGVQAVGAAFESYGSAIEPLFVGQGLEVSGNALISLGSALDAIGNLFLLKDQDNQAGILLFLGAWIEVIGSAMELAAVTITDSTARKELFDALNEEKENSDNEEGKGALYKRYYSTYCL
ncbi:DUF6944 family repetitive protein [Bacillus sp. 1P06AnD]|uniref:DUF6944 family repetitive protein n=1 Tax=Bacillus sp. 1P06AnD TaxID=3132208 RepID=UPI0039A1BEFC